MDTALTPQEWERLIRQVFAPGEGDRRLAVLCDLPDAERPDHDAWKTRREMARGWARAIGEVAPGLGLESVDLVLFRNARRNNADLPDVAYLHGGGALPDRIDDVEAESVPFEDVLSGYAILIAPTEYSATAPLKLAGPRHGFRAATMGGFVPEMVPAFRLDWVEIDSRCRALADLLDRAARCEAAFRVGDRTDRLALDLRHRTATASGGLLRERGKAGNLPSGETYIVPYEGEIDGDPSATEGVLPIELDGELLRYRIAGNRVVEVEGDGPVARRERDEIAREPAYANVAELGLGLLAGYGIRPVGTILLDEKLGLHIAFGRSDHFGGQVGAADFSSPDRVVHIDRVYIPDVQPSIVVEAVDLVFEGGERRALMRDGAYVDA